MEDASAGFAVLELVPPTPVGGAPLVEDRAIEQAEEECEADAGERALRRERAALRRAELDGDFIEKFASLIREVYPHCPRGREKAIAEHACRKYSGRVGRSAAAKTLDEGAVRLAVTAHVRHVETNYDELLMQGFERWEARDEVEGRVSQVLGAWEFGRS